MLSSAHILAMNAKNLLDVVDSIRMHYPHVNALMVRGSNQTDSSLSCESSSVETSSLSSGSAASSLEKRPQNTSSFSSLSSHFSNGFNNALKS